MKTLTKLFVIFFIIVSVSSCKKDDPTPDGNPPTGTVTATIEVAAGDEATFVGSFADDLGLTKISIVYSNWDLNKEITLSEQPLTYDLSYAFTVPGDAVAGDHTVTITAFNTSEKSTEFTVTVTVTEATIITYDEVFAVGGFQWWGLWAELGYIMIQDPVDSEWFEIIIHGWSDDGWDDIKFIGQLAWTPNNWGLVDAANPSSGMVNAETSEFIDMGAENSMEYPAYFKVRFNPYTLNYTVEEIDQSAFTPQTDIYIVGTGFTDYPLLDWNPEEAILMDNNSVHFYGPHIFVKEGLVFSDDVAIKFIGQNTGWDPVDVGFDTDYITDEDAGTDGYQVTAPISWLPNASGGGTADLKFASQAGTYTVLYDHFAKRTIIWDEATGKKVKIKKY